MNWCQSNDYEYDFDDVHCLECDALMDAHGDGLKCPECGYVDMPVEDGF